MGLNFDPSVKGRGRGGEGLCWGLAHSLIVLAMVAQCGV